MHPAEAFTIVLVSGASLWLGYSMLVKLSKGIIDSIKAPNPVE